MIASNYPKYCHNTVIFNFYFIFHLEIYMVFIKIPTNLEPEPFGPKPMHIKWLEEAIVVEGLLVKTD